MDKSELVRLIKNERKCEYLLSAATAFSSVEEKWLREAPYEDAYSWLTNIKGIGEWSANFVLIRGLGRMEKLFVEDHLAFAASSIYGSGKKPMDKQKVLELAKRYGKNQGYWGISEDLFRVRRNRKAHENAITPRFLGQIPRN